MEGRKEKKKHTLLYIWKVICLDEKLKQDIQGVIHDAENLAFDRTTRLFVYHNTSVSSSSSLEFFCCDIRKHEYNNRKVIDYYTATYSY